MVVADPYHANERHDARLVPFRAGDGLDLNLVHVRGERDATRGPVILVHGAGVRANLFNAPVPTTVVDALLERGYDVWLENWRASIDVPANEWTLDQAAVHDHPAAVRKVVEETGAEKVKAIIHCQGSTSFMMSALAGLVPEVETIVANAVSLHTVIPPVSRFKIRRVLPLVRPFFRYLDPQWGNEAPDLRAKAMVGFVKLTHHECDNDVCRLASFTYGTGLPTLWRHENLNDETHEWIKGEFAAVPLTFFKQMARCVRAGQPGLGRGTRRAAARLRRPAASDRCALRLLRRRPKPVLPAGEPAAHVPVLRGARARQARAARAARLRPPRRLHRQEREPGRVPADAGRARALRS